jgi:hypothetical protein
MSSCWILALLTAAACGGSSPGPSTTPTPPAPAPAAEALLGPDGKHVAKERVYEGDCMPAGTRGGCHTVTLRPDGTYRNFLFDAAMEGEYTIEGNVVSLSRPEPEPIKMTLSADGTMLDALPLKP